MFCEPHLTSSQTAATTIFLLEMHGATYQGGISRNLQKKILSNNIRTP
jgi:hypothetical protein